MCSSGDKTAKATEDAQAAFTKTLQASFQTAFGKNQAILDGLTKTLTAQMQNPKGFDPRTLALMRTTASDTVARKTLGAQTAAGSYIASHGGADLGSGVAAQISGGIASSGAEEQASEQSNIDIQNGLLQDQNYWKSIAGLTDVANAENPAGYAGQATSAANSVSDLSRSVLASKQAGWQNAFGIASGIAGLGLAGAGAFKDVASAGAAAGKKG